ncbi:hypothetical protein MMC22_005453, partial [Lobaria immixta]|nr:hypothetical protein [Lobaria immixta]
MAFGICNFPAAIDLCGLEHLSNALVCHKKWDNSLVMRDKDMVLSTKGKQYVQNWRDKAMAVAVETFQLVKTEEKLAF